MRVTIIYLERSRNKSGPIIKVVGVPTARHAHAHVTRDPHVRHDGNTTQEHARAQPIDSAMIRHPRPDF